MSFNGWINTQTVGHPYNGMLLSNKKEQTIDADNLDASQRIMLSEISYLYEIFKKEKL